ncbi:LOW QUALITY PROTEIN: hypothetical protein KUTeg_003924 [Tegillarca granosa]|uniref:DUF659 domain-containing protein n=1 Tax=Tegillarca granosa TaxID=220873 RepID=A0ABQ9FNK3_TEGGR|nr:LOW QUALITY PROTEIN: hypothetical protein KUTeg_003924 [Tegillarca granosa]
MRGTVVSLTTNIWTSLATEGYICLTAHYLDKNWQLQNKLLATRVMEDRHTGVNIGKIITELKNEFGIKELSVVTDNAANMEKTVREADMTHVDAHWKIIEELVPVLEPLADATEILAS